MSETLSGKTTEVWGLDRTFAETIKNLIMDYYLSLRDYEEVIKYVQISHLLCSR